MQKTFVLDHNIATWPGLSDYFKQSIPREDGVLIFEDIKRLMISRTQTDALHVDYYDVAQEFYDSNYKKHKGLIFVFDYDLKSATKNDKLLTLLVKYDLKSIETDVNGLVIKSSYSGHFMMGQANEIKAYLRDFSPILEREYLVIDLDQETTDTTFTLD